MKYCVGIVKEDKHIMYLGVSDDFKMALEYKKFRERINKTKESKIILSKFSNFQFEKLYEKSENFQSCSEIDYFGKYTHDVYLTEDDENYITSTITEELIENVQYSSREILKTLKYIDEPEAKKIRKKIKKLLDGLINDPDYDEKLWSTLDYEKLAEDIL